MRTDGDGIFGRSKTFQELKEKENFIHERPAPYDHRQSAKIDRECRTLLEGVNTALDQSGAPPNFWGEAADHFIFTRNMIPRKQVDTEGGGVSRSPNSLFENRDIHFNIKHLVAFGTQATCFIPPDRREGHKTPGQTKSYDGIIIGYAKDMQAYLVWDIKERKKREVSFFHTIIHEGFYPWREKKLWSKEERELPRNFSPTFEDILTPTEFKKFCFTEEEEKEILREYFPKGEKKESVETAVSVDELDGKHVEDGPSERTHAGERPLSDGALKRSTGEGKDKEEGENEFFVPSPLPPLRTSFSLPPSSKTSERAEQERKQRPSPSPPLPYLSL